VIQGDRLKKVEAIALSKLTHQSSIAN
jgi:hypothetical protein